MAWIITRLCRDCIDTACVSVCPVDCIYRYQGKDRQAFPNRHLDPAYETVTRSCSRPTPEIRIAWLNTRSAT